jgi:hypothetical protein
MSRRPDLQLSAVRLPPEKITGVHKELEHVLASPHFRASRRCQALLRRITELTLAEDVDRLKERSLGIEVFGRPADYDTSQDPVVRATAAEIRKKLAQHYLENGNDSEMRIELPAGAYHVEFHFAEPRTQGLGERGAAGRRISAIAALAFVLLVAAVFGLVALNQQPSALDRLWSPVLKSQAPVLVCVGLQAAFNFRSAQAQDAVQGQILSNVINYKYEAMTGMESQSYILKEILQ